jgi:hypothetical protein
MKAVESEIDTIRTVSLDDRNANWMMVVATLAEYAIREASNVVP